MSWDMSELVFYVDGRPTKVEPAATYAHADTWLDQEPVVQLGGQCFHPAFNNYGLPLCFADRFSHVVMDDWAMWSGALTPSEVLGRWNASLTARVAAGLEEVLPPEPPSEQLPIHPLLTPPRTHVRSGWSCSTTSTSPSKRLARSSISAPPATSTTWCSVGCRPSCLVSRCTTPSPAAAAA